MMQLLTEVMAAHWPAKLSSRKKASMEAIEYPDPTGNEGENVDGDDGDNDIEEPEGPCIQDDYAEACLAESLGVELVAHPVLPETQLPLDHPLYEPDSQPLEAQSPLHVTPPPDLAAEGQFKVDEELKDTPDNGGGSEVASTVRDQTPEKEKEVVEVKDSPVSPAAPQASHTMTTMVVKDPLPSKHKYTQEDLAILRAKIESVKPLA